MNTGVFSNLISICLICFCAVLKKKTLACNFFRALFNQPNTQNRKFKPSVSEKTVRKRYFETKWKSYPILRKITKKNGRKYRTTVELNGA